MKDAKILWPALILSSGLLCGLLYMGNPESVMLMPLALLFLFVGPGMAYVRLMRLVDWTVELMLGISLSLVLDILVAAAALYAGMWNPENVLWVLILLSWVGVGLQLWQVWLPGDGARSLSMGGRGK